LLAVVRDVVADVLTRNASKPVIAKQNDAGSRFLNVRIQENGKSMDIDGVDEVILNVHRPDGSTGMFRGSVNSDGTVKVELYSWVLEQAGTVSCDISIIKENSVKLTTMTFYIEVEAAACCDGDLVETDDYLILVDLVNQTQEACNRATEAANLAAATVQECSDATQSAIDAANTANNSADIANTAAASAESAAQAANTAAQFILKLGVNCGYELPTPGTAGRLFFLIAEKA